MLYKNTEERLSEETFRHPGKEYRGAPFWAWNGALDRETLQAQIRTFKEMGMGGFHIHVRTGLKTPYLSDEFMDYVRFCAEKARAEDMLVWLYDEDRWPSGTAGGRVTHDHPEYRSSVLLLTTVPYGEAGPILPLGEKASGRASQRRAENGTLLAVYDVVLDAQHCLRTYRQISA